MAAATAVEASAGTRRAVVRSERFMEWQRELSSSRATYGGRKRHDDADAVENAGIKKFYGKRHSSDEDGVKLPRQEGSEERNGDGNEPVVADSQATEGTGVNSRPRVKKQQQHQRQRTDPKKQSRKESDAEQKKVSQSKDSAAPADGGRMRRCKQQAAQPSQTAHPRRQQQAQQHDPESQQQTSLTQPTARRRQRRVPRTFTPPKEEAERELRSLTRNRGSETPPQPPAAPASKATKRSKRVAQRLAHEEPTCTPPLKLPKLHLVLTRKEIQEDWLKITGHKYTGKPKKSTLIQRGLGLCTSLTCPSTIRYLNEPQCKCSLIDEDLD